MPDELSDIELWDLAVDGDQEGFGVLFERHARSVYNHCFGAPPIGPTPRTSRPQCSWSRGGDDVTCDRSVVTPHPLHGPLEARFVTSLGDEVEELVAVRRSSLARA